MYIYTVRYLISDINKKQNNFKKIKLNWNYKKIKKIKNNLKLKKYKRIIKNRKRLIRYIFKLILTLSLILFNPYFLLYKFLKL